MLRMKFAMFTTICIVGSLILLTGCGTGALESSADPGEYACDTSLDSAEDGGICNGQCDEQYKKFAELWLLCAAD